MSNNDDPPPPLLAASSSLSLVPASSSGSTPTTPATPTATAISSLTPTEGTTASACFTPTAKDTQEWTDFSKRVNVSPPICINKSFNRVIEEADFVLKRSRLQQDDGSPYTWDSLEADHQAGMAFIINEAIVDCFPRGVDKYKRIAHGVLGVDLEENGRTIIHGQAIRRDLLQFVRKNGDLVNLTGNVSTNYGAEMYGKFISEYKQLWGDKRVRKEESCAMFSSNFQVEPIVRLQAEYSMVCAFVVSSLMIHYRQAIHPEGGILTVGAASSPRASYSTAAAQEKQGRKSIRDRFRNLQLLGRAKSDRNAPEILRTSPPDHRRVAVLAGENEIETKAGNYTLNIGRYMRHTLTAMEKYETIFEGKGFIFEDVMNGLLRLSNKDRPEGGFLNSISILGNDADLCFKQVAEQLAHGALCARIRLSRDYEATTMCVKAPGLLFTNDFHFVTIIGVSRSNPANPDDGLMFLVQDSLRGQQLFKNISLEWMRLASTKCLVYIPHDFGIKMPDQPIFDLKPEDIVTAGGVTLQKSGIPRFTDGSITDEEKKKNLEKAELWRAAFLDDYKPPWARGDDIH